MRRAALIAILALACVACDEARVRDGVQQFAEHEEAAMRVFVTPEGIGNIYEVANPDGFALVGEAETIVDGPDGSVELGPIEQTLPIRSRAVEPAVGALQVELQLRTPQIYVPVHLRRGFNVRICRYRVSGTLLTATGFVTLVETAEGPELDVTAAPVVELVGANVDSLESCASDMGELITSEALAAALIDYVTVSVANSAATALRTSPLDVLGLIRRNLQISRLSTFENRRGVLAVEGIAPQRADALALTPDGLVATVDATADAERARCAPPVGLDPHQAMGTADVDPALVRRFGADFALAISGSWIQRLAQAATLAGFACHGLERINEIGGGVLLDTDEALLGELGLDALPLGDQVRLVVRPGSLPLVSNDAGNGTIEVVWEDLQIEVYGQLFGAWSRIVSVVSDARLNLRPQSPSLGAAVFGLETLEVTAPEIDSEFLAVVPDEARVTRWTQRTLLLLLEERLTLPLPLDAGSGLRVVNTQVREADVVYYLRFE